MLLLIDRFQPGRLVEGAKYPSKDFPGAAS